MLNKNLRTAPLAKLAAALAMLAYASSASAFFDVELLAGKRWYQTKAGEGKTHGIASQEIDVAAHIDPIPLVPISFGALVGLGSLNKNDLGPDVSEASTFEAGLDVMAWIPMVPIVTPYARLTIPVVGSMAYKSKTTTNLPNPGDTETVAGTYKISGYHLNAGIKYSPIPLVRILAEVGMGAEKIKADEIKVGGNKISASDPTVSDEYKSNDLSSKSFMLGIEVGI